MYCNIYAQSWRIQALPWFMTGTLLSFLRTSFYCLFYAQDTDFPQWYLHADWVVLVTKTKIYVPNTTAPTKISGTQFNYLENIYRATTTDTTAMNTFLSSLSLPHLTSEQQTHMDAPLTEDTVKQAINVSSNGKTKAPDG